MIYSLTIAALFLLALGAVSIYLMFVINEAKYRGLY